MKKSELKRIIQEELKGYSKYYPGGETKGGTSDEFGTILRNIALGTPDEDSEEDNIVGDKETVYEGEGNTMSLSQLVEYLKELSPEVQLYIPTIYPGGFGKDQQTKRTVDQAVKELTDLLGSSAHNETEFKLYQDSPTFKKFSVVQSPEELARRTAMVRSMGSLD